MSVALLDLLFTFTLWWTLLSVGYGLMLLGLDALWQSARLRREARRQQEVQQAQLDDEVRAAVRCLGAAFSAAQQHIRTETVSRGRGGR